MTDSLVVDDIAEAISILANLKLEYIQPEDLDRYRNLLAVQSELAASAAWLNPVRLIPEKAFRNLAQGVPLVDPGALDIPGDWADDALFRIAGVLFGPDETDRVFSGGGTDSVSVLKWAVDSRGAFDATERIGKMGIDTDALRLLARETIRPLFWKLKEPAAGRVSYAEWTFGCCPVCGSKPDFAVLEGEEGYRYPVCSLCDFRWRFYRLRCVFCDNTDEKTLRYILIDSEDYYRIDVCDFCRGYLKTIDARKWTLNRKIHPRIERVTMLHLDALAEREGFSTCPVVH